MQRVATLRVAGDSDPVQGGRAPVLGQATAPFAANRGIRDLELRQPIDDTAARVAGYEAVGHDQPMARVVDAAAERPGVIRHRSPRESQGTLILDAAATVGRHVFHDPAIDEGEHPEVCYPSTLDVGFAISDREIPQRDRGTLRNAHDTKCRSGAPPPDG